MVCSRSDVLAAGTSYQPITITLNVASECPSVGDQCVAVSGGGGSNPANNTASDADDYPAGSGPDAHEEPCGNFTQGQPGTYGLTAGNTGGSPTSGSVTRHRQRSRRLVPTSAAGTGWTCNIAAQGVFCNRSDPGREPAIRRLRLMVAVAANAAASVTNTAIVFGGGEINPSNNTAADPTTIAPGPDLTITKSHTGNFTQGQTGNLHLDREQPRRLADQRLGYGHRQRSPWADSPPAAGTGWTCNIASAGSDLQP